MGIKYACFADNQIHDHDVDPCTGYVDRHTDDYDFDGEMINRYGLDTFFCPAHDPAGDPLWEAIPNFNFLDYVR